MIPFIELIYADTQVRGKRWKVYVNVNGEYDRHLYRSDRPEGPRVFGEVVSFFLPMNRRADLNWSPSIAVTK